ncbi:hypothetical protein FKP32DRAFT_1730595 [Trametes sanguinea]|nr:hypothetical protein FKP32DRAFT_1730595 [Trametes sanguinea]
MLIYNWERIRCSSLLAYCRGRSDFEANVVTDSLSSLFQRIDPALAVAMDEGTYLDNASVISELMDPSEPALQLATPDAALAARRESWNMRQAVNSLPVETLVAIFAYLNASFPPTMGRQKHYNAAEWFKMMLVCRRWWMVIRTTPFFWRRMYIGERTRWADLCLDRSGNACLDLCFIVAYAQFPPPSLILRLANCRDRIERLEYSSAWFDRGRGVLSLLDMTLPSLVSLYLSPSHTPRSPQYEFDPETCPRISRLKLTYTSFPWTAPILGRLRALDLCWCHVVPSSIPFSDFLNVLQSAQQLEELALTECMTLGCSYSSVSDTLPTAPIVSLPNLRDLRISDTTVWVSRFLAHVKLPTRGCVSISASLELNQYAEYSRLVQHAAFFPTQPERQLPIFQTATRVALRIGRPREAAWNISCVAPGWECRATVNGRRCPTSPTSSMPLPPVHELNLAIGPEGMAAATAALNELTTAFPGVQKLEIGHEEEALRSAFPTEFFEVLFRHSDDGSDEDSTAVDYDRPRWPKLASLHIRGLHWSNGSYLPFLYQCLSDRAECGASKLESLRLSIFRDSDECWVAVDRLFQEAFRVFADTCTLTIQPLSGW